MALALLFGGFGGLEFVGHYPLLLFKGLIRQRHSGTAAREQFADRHKTVADFRLWRA